jgi:hypothetical protein
VAALVVVLLEPIQVEHGHAQRPPVASGAGQLPGKVLVPGPAVGQAGQVVRARHGLEARQQVGALDRHRRLRREKAHQRAHPLTRVGDPLRPGQRQDADWDAVPDDRLP